MLSILTKTGPWKIPGVLWRVLRKSGFYCSILEISRKGSLHKGRLLSDDFFELNRGQRRRRKKVLFRNVSSPSLSFDTHLVLLIQAHFRYQYKQGIKGKIEKNHHHKQKKSASGESRIELYSSYLSFLGMSYFIANGGTTLAKEVMSAQHWILRGLFVNKFLTW